MLNSHDLTRDKRLEIVKGYDQLVKWYRRKGLVIYFINFMFNQLPGSQNTQKEIMKRNVERVHDILARNVARKPKSKLWKHLRPIFIGCPDYPVGKKKKASSEAVSVNEGLHFNVIACVPKKRPKELGESGLRLSRLRVGLKRHFRERASWYLNGELSRIHVTRVTKGTMASYALKAFINGRISADDVAVF